MGFPGAPSPCWDQTGPCPLALVMTSPGPCPKTGLCKARRPRPGWFKQGERTVGSSLCPGPSELCTCREPLTLTPNGQLVVSPLKSPSPGTFPHSPSPGRAHTLSRSSPHPTVFCSLEGDFQSGVCLYCACVGSRCSTRVR